MANDKINIEELEKQCMEAEKKFKDLHDKLTIAKKEEEESKKVKLAKEKQARYEEVVAVYEHFEQLRSAYVNDYGYFTFETTNKKGDSHSWFWESVGLA